MDTWARAAAGSVEALVDELVRMPSGAAVAELQARLPELDRAACDRLVSLLEARLAGLRGAEGWGGPPGVREAARVQLLLVTTRAARGPQGGPPPPPPPPIVAGPRPAPPDEAARAALVDDLLHRRAAVLRRVVAGAAGEREVVALKSVLASTEWLLQLGPPARELYTLDEVARCRADALQALALAYEAMGAAASARDFYRQAVEAYEEAGEVARARAALARSERVPPDPRREVRRLRRNLARQPHPSTERVRLLHELGEALLLAGEAAAAERVLEQARAEREELRAPGAGPEPEGPKPPPAG